MSNGYREYIPGQRLKPGETLVPAPGGKAAIIGPGETPPPAPPVPGALPQGPGQVPIPERVETSTPTTRERYDREPQPDAEILSISATSGKDRYIVKTQIPEQTEGVSEQFLMSEAEIRKLSPDIFIPKTGIVGFGAGTRWAPPPPAEKAAAVELPEELKDYPLRVQQAYKEGGPAAANRAIEEYNAYVERFKKSMTAAAEKRFRENVRATSKFFKQLRELPPEIQKGWYEGGQEGLDKAIIEYNEKMSKTLGKYTNWEGKVNIHMALLDWKEHNGGVSPDDLRQYFEDDIVDKAVEDTSKIISIDRFNEMYNDAWDLGGYKIHIGTQYMDADKWLAIPDKYKAIARRAGSFEPMIKAINADNARIEATSKALDKYTDKDGGINLYLAIADWKEGRNPEASPERIKEVMHPDDHKYVDKAVKAYEVSRKTAVALPGEERQWLNVQTGKIISDAEHKALGSSAEYDKYVLTPAAGRRKFIDLAQWVFQPTRALKPEVEVKDIHWTEWAVGGAQLASLVVAPVIGGTVGKVLFPMAGAAFITRTALTQYEAKKAGYEIPAWQLVLGYGVGALAMLPGISLAKSAIARIRPTVLTGESLALTADVGRVRIPKGMSQMAARQLAADIERLQLNGKISARELQPLRNVPNVDHILISRKGGTVDIVLKSADGNAVGHIPGMQRINSDIIYHATDDADSVLKQIEEKGYFEVKGKQPRGGLFLSQQPAQQFMFNVAKGKPVKSPGMFAVRLAQGELKAPPKSVMDQPTLGAMREKMYELNRAGKLKPGVYVLTKGYGSPLTLEYEVYAADGTRFYPAAVTKYAPGPVPQLKVTSLVGYNGPGVRVRPGDTVPLYWLGSPKALKAGAGVPSIKQLYAAKLLGDLTTIRQYAPWNLRLGRPAAGEGEVYAGNRWRSAIEQIRLKAVPEDTGAGRVSAIVRDNKGRILLTRTQGQNRFDLPGGGVTKKFLRSESINKAMARELTEEVNIRPEYLEHIDTFESSFNPGGTTCKFQIFETVTTAKPRPSVEIAEYVWWDGHSSLKYPVAEFVKDALKRYRLRASSENIKIVDTALEKAGESTKALDDISAASDELVSESLKQSYERGVLPYEPTTVKPGAVPFSEQVDKVTILSARKTRIKAEPIERGKPSLPERELPAWWAKPRKAMSKSEKEERREWEKEFNRALPARREKMIEDLGLRPNEEMVPYIRTGSAAEFIRRYSPASKRYPTVETGEAAPIEPPPRGGPELVPPPPETGPGPETVPPPPETGPGPETVPPPPETIETIETVETQPPGTTKVIKRFPRTDAERRKVIKEAGGALTLKMGRIGGKDRWDTVIYPYSSNRDYLMVLGNPPEGATILERGPGSAYATAQMIRGRPPTRKIRLDSGIMDIIIKPHGRTIKAEFIPDPDDLTRGDITIGQRTPRISERTPPISRRGTLITPRTPRITPRTPRLV